MQKITPCLWFDGNAEQAVNFYVDTLPQTRITYTNRFNAESAAVSGQPEDAVMSLVFEVAGQSIMALNGGPQFSFTPAISLVLDCVDQDEVDQVWESMLKGGEAMQCGWITDRFGVTWQIVPAGLAALINNQDAGVASRATQAMLGMTKLDISQIHAACEQA